MKKVFILIAVGLACGAVNGFFGGGAGLILVPLLGLTGLEIKKCHATSVAVTLPLSVVTLVVYIFGGRISTDNIWLFVAGGCIGGIAGAFVLKKIPTKLLKLAFALFMTASAVRLWFM